MDDSLFGPWSMDPPVNKWNEWKIGKLDSWYTIAALSLQTSAAATSSNSSASTERNISSSHSSSRENQSMIPRYSKRIQKNSKKGDPIVEEQILIENNPKPTVELPKPQPRFGVRENWDEPRSFEQFISSPSYGLFGWPTKNISIQDAIGGLKDNPVKPPSGRSPKQRRSQIPTKKFK